jgi:hypothetical protein
MGVRLALEASTAEILKAVEGWVNLLEQEDYERAYAYTEQDEQYQWTPDLIQSVIYSYGFQVLHSHDEFYRITPVNTDSAGNRSPRQEVDFYQEPLLEEAKEAAIIGQVWYDLPLNGEWSDLTATFKVVRRETYLTLELAEIRVFD